jgi:hypothetical protein
MEELVETTYQVSSCSRTFDFIHPRDRERRPVIRGCLIARVKMPHVAQEPSEGSQILCPAVAESARGLVAGSVPPYDGELQVIEVRLAAPVQAGPVRDIVGIGRYLTGNAGESPITGTYWVFPEIVIGPRTAVRSYP